jgi:GxxExxY protein
MLNQPATQRDPETFAIIGAAMEVHRTLGAGFLEAVYQEALAIEFHKRGVDAIEQVPLTIMYNGQALRTAYRPDFIVAQQIIVEIKALDVLTGRERAQVLNYLRAARVGRGLLINFGAPSLQYERLVWNWQRSSQSVPSASSAQSAD